jgi:hypothetical protein
MKAYVFAVISLVFFAFPGAALANRLALVIGNDSYENLPALQKARNDAAAIAEMLGQLGYDVALLQDADRRTMTKSLSDLAAQIETDAEVVFYFAGHGVEISGRNYLIPTDAPAAGPEEEAFLTAESVAVDQVLETIRSRGARITLLILDACRDNPFPKADTRSLGGERGLAPVVPPEGTFILFSAGAGQTALDGMGAQDSDPNSVFTRALLQRLQEPGQAIQDVARTVRRDVEALAATINHKQRPAYYDELTDDFFLSAAGSRGAKPIDSTAEDLVISQQDKLGVPPPDDTTADPIENPTDEALAQATKAAELAVKAAKEAAAEARRKSEELTSEVNTAANELTATETDDDIFHMSPDQIPENLADEPCFYAGNAMVKLSYPYKIDELLAFAKTYADCEALSQGMLDIARELEAAQQNPVAAETWRVKKGVSEGHMNVRDGRGTDFPVLFQIAEGVGGFTVKICMPPETGGGKKDWCLIEHEGKRGWISSGGIERE